MQKQFFRIVFVGLILTMVGGSCFADDVVYKFRLPGEFEPIYGTWVNSKYPGTLMYAQKWVYYEWGYGELFLRTSDKDPSSRNTFILVEKWEDNDGNTWYKELDILPNGERFFCLNRISSDGDTFEEIWGIGDFPKESEMNPASSSYHVYYRE